MKKIYLSLLVLFYVMNSFAINPPVLTTPVNNATDQSTNPTLTWQAVTGATSYEYQYSTNASFSSFWNDYLSATEATLSNLNNNYTYYWRVRASDGNTNSDWSEIWHFTTQTATSGLATPTLVSPINDATNVIVTPSLLWNVVPSASEYEYQYSTDNTFVTYTTGTTQSTTISIGTLETNTLYFWRIKATDGNTFSDWSEIWHFTTEGSVGIQETKFVDFELFPNPVDKILTLKSNTVIKAVSMIDVLGKKVYTNMTQFNTDILIDTSFIKKGIYFIRLDFKNNSSTTKKIVVSH